MHHTLHPKLELLGGERVPLLGREGLTRPPHEGPLVGGAAVLLHATHALVSLRGEVGPGGFPLEGSNPLIEAQSWLAVWHVTLSRMLLLVMVVV